jgi:peroxiredoxin
MLEIGTMAPDFALENHRRDTIRLSDFRGKKNVVLAFHPLAFTPVCSLQMQTYQKALPTFDSLDTVVLGLSLDAGPSKAAWAESLGGITFDLLSDFPPYGKVAGEYQVLRPDGIPDRALYLIDKSGRIAWRKLHQMPDLPELEELLGQIRQLPGSGD